MAIDSKIRARCEQYGLEMVRKDLGGVVSRFFSTDSDLKQAFEWVQEQHLLSERRAAANLWWARVGGSAAIVAAVASIFALFTKGH